MMPEYKLVVCGPGITGKSAITTYFVQHHFVAEYYSTIEDSYRKQVEIDNQPCCLDILDTAGQEEYSAMRGEYMRSAQGFLVVYSVISRESFNEVNSFMEQIRCAKPAGRIPIVLCGNICDMDKERQVSTMEGINLAQSLGCPFFETSAKTSLNVESAFFEVVREIKRTH
ncbi:Ras GTPase [Pelomyxa schiedti]|nr:Ras GTPase [Pelomyxa schiedti]